MCPTQRTALVDWTCRLHAAASGDGPPLSLHTRFLAVNLVDRFLSTGEGGLVACGTRGGLEVAGAPCLGIASKYEDTQAVATSLWGLAEAATWGGTNIYSGGADDKLHAARKDIVAMELRVLAALSYRVTVSYCICFVYFFWYLRWAWNSLFIYLVDEPKISLYGRETDRDLRSACRCVA